MINVRRNKPAEAKIASLYPAERRFLQDSRIRAFESDPNLKQADLNKWLGLGDTDVSIKNSIWKMRMARLAQENSFTPAQICAQALLEARQKSDEQETAAN